MYLWIEESTRQQVSDSKSRIWEPTLCERLIPLRRSLGSVVLSRCDLRRVVVVVIVVVVTHGKLVIDPNDYENNGRATGAPQRSSFKPDRGFVCGLARLARVPQLYKHTHKMVS